jgi:hypothetical protein
VSALRRGDELLGPGRPLAARDLPRLRRHVDRRPRSPGRNPSGGTRRDVSCLRRPRPFRVRPTPTRGTAVPDLRHRAGPAVLVGGLGRGRLHVLRVDDPLPDPLRRARARPTRRAGAAASRGRGRRARATGSPVPGMRRHAPVHHGRRRGPDRRVRPVREPLHAASASGFRPTLRPPPGPGPRPPGRLRLSRPPTGRLGDRRSSEPVPWGTAATVPPTRRRLGRGRGRRPAAPSTAPGVSVGRGTGPPSGGGGRLRRSRRGGSTPGRGSRRCPGPRPTAAPRGSGWRGRAGRR